MDNFNKNNNNNDQVSDFFRKLSEKSQLDGAKAQQTQQPEYMKQSIYRESEQRREPVGTADNMDVVFYPSNRFKEETPAPPVPNAMRPRPDEAPGKSQHSPEKKKPAFVDGKPGKKAGGDKPAGKNGKKKKKSDVPVWKRMLKVALYALCAMAVVVCVLAVVIAIYLSKETVGDEELLDLNAIRLSYASQLMAYNEETDEWEEYQRIYNDENRIWVNYEDMPDELINCIVASEDQRFWEHKGVDEKRTAAAMLDLVLKKMGFGGIWEDTQGGSTLTQQLIKNITDEDEVDVMRKIREIYRAYQLEKRFSKEQILEAYLNTFRLSGQVAGIEAGANYYFDTTTSELTTAQCAAIVCITKAPTAHDPFMNPDENKYQRENVVLWMMHEQGRLTDTDYQKALDESESFVFDQPGGTHKPGEVYTWFTDTAIREVINDLQNYGGYSAEEAERIVYREGVQIRLTIDTKVQEVCEDVATNGYTFNDKQQFQRVDFVTDENGEPVLDEDGDKIIKTEDDDGNPLYGADAETMSGKNGIPQSAFVVMDYEGNIKGLAGQLYKKEASLIQNIAVDSVRQTGSTMKPIGAYVLPLEYNYITYSTTFMDTPYEGTWPRNFSRSYSEIPVTVADGIANSLNTTAVKALDRVGYDISYDFVTTNLGITSLVETDRSMAPMALGSMTYGISPMQMCAAYAIFGNGGTYYMPRSYTVVLNAKGEVILDKTKYADIATNQAISEDTAMVMNKLLQGVIRVGTGVRANPGGSLPYAGKSGTTSDNKDFWFIGMNPYYVCAVWEGYADASAAVAAGYENAGMLTQLTPHPTQLIFKEVMGRISNDLEYKDFPQSAGVVSETYCKDSGYLASPACPNTATGWYKVGNIPEMCNHAYDVLPWEDDDE